jgi:hypothetical protein
VDANHLEPSISRRARRRQHRKAQEARHLRETERDAFLRSQLQTGEAIVAHRDAVMVTDRRVLFAWEAHLTGGVRWHADAVAFEEITRWSLGRRHDERPLLRIEHPTHLRTERVAARHFLWFSWGNAEAEVPHDDVTLAFASERDEAFRPTFDRLEKLSIPRGEDFVVSLPDTRERRTRGSQAYLRRS